MEDKVLSEYFELLRYESVGADPSHLRDCVSCASWLRKWLGALGFSAELVYPKQEPGGALPPPVVFAERKGGEAAATVLVYGHYDVQPADPVSEWDTPPFEPTMKDGRVYCRGANDDKGQTFALLCGMRDYLAAEGPKLNIKIVLDGQEESGSGALMALAPEMRRRLAADVLLVCDTSAAPSMRPAIVAGLRGVAHFTLRLTGPNRDLHSGEYGGIAPNPAQGMAELLASLHHPDGSIAVAGFRDGIEPPTHEETSAAEASTPSEEECAADIGCETAGGQMGKTIAQRVSFEPTIEVNGIHSGYGGPGAKTVIPCEAVAKISMRLVPGQSPRGAFAAVRTHLDDRCPKGMKVSFEDVNPGTPAFRLPLASPVFRLASHVLSEMDGRGALFQWDGASIPVLSVLREASGAAPLVVGWGQAQDRIHSPNESYSVEQFDRAREWGRRILEALG
jgi:acetylornithine deacetylase/succinyl-diaminopimelate desuccinylase-like protein